MEGGLRQPLWKGRLTPKGLLTAHRLRDTASEIKFPVSKFWGTLTSPFVLWRWGPAVLPSDPSASAFPTVVTADLLLHLLWGTTQSLAPRKVSCVPLSPLPLALPNTALQDAGDLGPVSVTLHQLAYPRVLWNRTGQYSFWCCFLSWLLVLVVITLCSSIL